jgi:hypothetical protein
MFIWLICTLEPKIMGNWKKLLNKSRKIFPNIRKLANQILLKLKIT